MPCGRQAAHLSSVRRSASSTERLGPSISCYRYIAVNNEEDQPRRSWHGDMSLYMISSFVVAFVLLGAVVGLTLAQRDDSFLFPDQLPEKPQLAVNECFVPVSFTSPRRRVTFSDEYSSASVGRCVQNVLRSFGLVA